MADARHLKNAPILEAVLEFHFADAELDRPSLERLTQRFVDHGWKRQEINSFEATLGPIEPASAVSVASNFAFQGFVVHDSDKKHFAQFHSSRVSASNAGAYETWEALEEQARPAFQAFVEAANPRAVNRISTRFINRLPPYTEFTQYGQVLERPPLPLEGLAGANVSDFLRRHVLENIEGIFSANLTLGTVAPNVGEIVGAIKPFILDIDVFAPVELTPSFEVVRVELSKLRRIKNELFFGSLKNALVEKFE